MVGAQLVAEPVYLLVNSVGQLLIALRAISGKREIDLGRFTFGVCLDCCVTVFLNLLLNSLLHWLQKWSLMIK